MLFTVRRLEPAPEVDPRNLDHETLAPLNPRRPLNAEGQIEGIAATPRLSPLATFRDAVNYECASREAGDGRSHENQKSENCIVSGVQTEDRHQPDRHNRDHGKHRSDEIEAKRSLIVQEAEPSEDSAHGKSINKVKNGKHLTLTRERMLQMQIYLENANHGPARRSKGFALISCKSGSGWSVPSIGCRPPDCPPEFASRALVDSINLLRGRRRILQTGVAGERFAFRKRPRD